MKDFDINKIAELAMLELGAEEKASLSKDMADIVAFAERIAEAGASVQEWEEQNVPLREDIAGVSLSAGEALLAAPEKKDGFFFVPQVVE